MHSIIGSQIIAEVYKITGYRVMFDPPANASEGVEGNNDKPLYDRLLDSIEPVQGRSVGTIETQYREFCASDWLFASRLVADFSLDFFTHQGEEQNQGGELREWLLFPAHRFVREITQTAEEKLRYNGFKICSHIAHDVIMALVLGNQYLNQLNAAIHKKHSTTDSNTTTSIECDRSIRQATTTSLYLMLDLLKLTQVNFQRMQ